MERSVKLYIGNAAKFNPEKYYELSEYTVNDQGDVFDLYGNKLKEHTREGYKYVRLVINGKEKSCKVHRIVACTFQDICGDFNEVVNHLDEDKTNNKASNLRWTTNYENTHYGSIEERKKRTIEENRRIKVFVKKWYFDNDIKYTKNVKIKKLKRRIRITDKPNNIKLYIPFSDIPN